MKIEPSADLRAVSTLLFEAYQAHVDAGFTKEQALALVAVTLDHALKTQTKKE